MVSPIFCAAVTLESRYLHHLGFPSWNIILTYQSRPKTSFPNFRIQVVFISKSKSQMKNVFERLLLSLMMITTVHYINFLILHINLLFNNKISSCRERTLQIYECVLMSINQGLQLSGQQLALGNNGFLVPTRSLTICRDALSAIITQLISK